MARKHRVAAASSCTTCAKSNNKRDLSEDEEKEDAVVNIPQNYDSDNNKISAKRDTIVKLVKTE